MLSDRIEVNQPLKSHLDAAVSDVFRADEAYLLLREVGESARQINAAGFGAFFAPIQGALTRDYLLAVARLYDLPDRKYPTRSIRTLVDALERSIQTLKIGKSPAVLRRLKRAGIESTDFQLLTDSAVTARLVNWCRRHLVSGETVESIRVSRAFEALRFHRDKVIAHNELIATEPAPKVTFDQVNLLLDLAKTIVDLVSSAYFNCYQTADDGSFILTKDAGRPAACFQRLLRGIISTNAI